MKCAILHIAALLLCSYTYAQFPYVLTTHHQLYQPLPDTCPTLNNTVWFNSDNYGLSLPFPFKIDSIDCAHPFIEGGCTLITDTGVGVVSAFFLADANFIDKGFLGSDLITRSPIRYTTTGAAGSRIFKIEVANAGFFNEITYATNNDSVYMQIWLYEQTNVIELRYGPSHISHAYNYFPNNGYPTIGYVRDIDYSLNGIYYTLAGDPSSPSIDSETSVNGVFVEKPLGLNHFPPDGTVYRFTPTSLTIGHPSDPTATSLKTFTVYPTYCHDALMVAYNTQSLTATYRIVAINGAQYDLHGVLQYGITYIDVSQLPQGTYIIEMTTGGSICKQKFVKM